MNELKHVLKWLLVANSSISLQQIAEAISVQPKDKWFEIDGGVYTTPDDVVALLGGLTAITTVGNMSFAQLTHYSVEEYLVSDRIRESNVAAFYINISMAHANVAKTCLQYLSFADFEDSCTTNQDGTDINQISKRSQKYQLYKYAANNWFYHLREVRSTTKRSIA